MRRARAFKNLLYIADGYKVKAVISSLPMLLDDSNRGPGEHGGCDVTKFIYSPSSE